MSNTVSLLFKDGVPYIRVEGRNFNPLNAFHIDELTCMLCGGDKVVVSVVTGSILDYSMTVGLYTEVKEDPGCYLTVMFKGRVTLNHLTDSRDEVFAREVYEQGKELDEISVIPLDNFDFFAELQERVLTFSEELDKLTVRHLSAEIVSDEHPLGYIAPMVPPIAPVLIPSLITADFKINVRIGRVPLEVGLSNRSTGRIESMFWDFHDGESDFATAGDSTHTYTNPGSYPITLTVRSTDAREMPVIRTRTEIVHVLEAQ